MMMVLGKVEDDEVLYRSVPDRCFTIADGALRLTSTAFNDPAQKPSVDRAKLCDANPAYTRKRPTDGVVSLTACSVRQIADVVQNDKHGNPKLAYAIDVIPDPVKDHPLLSDNLAHAIIMANPDFESGSVFRKLKESLARIASQGGWVVEPFVASK